MQAGELLLILAHIYFLFGSNLDSFPATFSNAKQIEFVDIAVPNLKHNNIYLLRIFLCDFVDIFPGAQNDHFLGWLIVAPIYFLFQFFDVLAHSDIVFQIGLAFRVQRSKYFANVYRIVFAFKLVLHLFLQIYRMLSIFGQPGSISAAQVINNISFFTARVPKNSLPNLVCYFPAGGADRSSKRQGSLESIKVALLFEAIVLEKLDVAMILANAI